MIANPSVPTFLYDPYLCAMTRESYDHLGMRSTRKAAICAASSARVWGIIMGTLGRQGNARILANLQRHLSDRGVFSTLFLISEIHPDSIASFSDIEAWVQISCPRLSIDWGTGFVTPMLTPHEALLALGVVLPF